MKTIDTTTLDELTTQGQLKFTLQRLINAKKITVNEFKAAIEGVEPETFAAEVLFWAKVKKADCKLSQNGVAVSNAYYVEQALIEKISGRECGQKAVI